ncbi:unnamed protein product [Mytilus edulis]|uniref:Uncharacterized protein n=1 Tax=Mytilus edulis TaxID=6550 RepID=A0A8S3UFB0_MYTED|nr:unnamed protein product [Mytilus edulis]
MTSLNFRGAAHSLFLTGDHSMSSTLGGFRNDRLRSLRALQIKETHPIITDNIEFHLNKGEHDPKLKNVFLDISAEVAAELNGDYSQVGTAKASKTYKLGMEAHAAVGELRKRNTINTETWNVVYPTTIPPKTKITLTSSLTRSTMNVPYTVTFRQGKKKWTESGTYRGVDHHGFVTEFKEEPL